jgi:hypothetical protein
MAVLNPRSAPYNAAGNGTTDDTTALQRCFNDAKAGGRPMVGTGTQEMNISTATPGDQIGSIPGTPLTANGSPTTVMGLGYLGSPPPEGGWDLPMDIIFI